MKKIDSDAKQRIYDVCGVGGDWFGKLDPHEAGYIAGTIGGIINDTNEMIDKKCTTGQIVEYLAPKMDHELATLGQMHTLTSKGIEQIAEEIEISELFKTGYKKEQAPSEVQKPGWSRILSSDYERHKAGIPKIGD